MILEDLIDELHCPYCGSGLQRESGHSSWSSEDDRYGIVRCACYRYPIIDGILVLRQEPGRLDTRNKAVERIEAGDREGSLHYAMNSMSPIPLPRGGRLRRLTRFLGRSSSLSRKLDLLDHANAIKRVCDSTLSFRQALSLLRPAIYSDYLFHRYANNSFLAAIAILLLLKDLESEIHTLGQSCANQSGEIRSERETDSKGEKEPGGKRRVLDLACGVGHSTFLISSLFPDISVVAADHDFINLYMARRFLAPDVSCICLDAEIPLPFADSSFDGIFCLDGFHYVRSKVALLAELDRVLNSSGLWLFPHLHNAKAHNVSAGLPLAYKDYSRCFDFIEHRILSEAEVLRGFMTDHSLDLGVAPTADRLKEENAFIIVASRRSDLWRKHRNIASLLWRRSEALAINPIYRVTDNGEKVRLEMNWPNAILESECAVVKEYLPEECEIDQSQWDRLTNGSLVEADESAIQKLKNSFVLVPLPRGYSDLALQ